MYVAFELDDLDSNYEWRIIEVVFNDNSKKYLVQYKAHPSAPFNDYKFFKSLKKARKCVDKNKISRAAIVAD